MFETSVEIAADPEDVWAVLVDVERWPEWTASMSEVKLLDSTALDVGARVRIKQPKLPAAVWVVTDLEPRRSFTWKAAVPGVTTFGDHQLSPQAHGRVTVTLGIRRAGPLAPVVNRVFGRLTREYVQMEADGLKRRCETAP